jgi:hypothetical protein
VILMSGSDSQSKLQERTTMSMSYCMLMLSSDFGKCRTSNPR